MGKKFVDPEEIPAKLITAFFREIEDADKKDFFDRGSDHFGTEKIHYLMLSLEAIDAEQRHWDSVLDFVLRRANGGPSMFYTLTLLSLSPHVSIAKREEIVRHFCKTGSFDHVLHLTSIQLFRKMNEEEIVLVARYHREHRTSSDGEIWKKLLDAAKDLVMNDALVLILQMVAEIKEDEDNPSMY